jgi:hypothetical protein
MNGIPWDYTFCSGSRCAKSRACLRWIRHPWNERIPKDRMLSMAEFSDHDGSCRGKFIPETEEPPKVSKDG